MVPLEKLGNSLLALELTLGRVSKRGRTAFYASLSAIKRALP